MREEAFEESIVSIGKALGEAIGTKPKKHYDRTELILLGLAQKTLSHCSIALDLIRNDASAEAMIILRSAYEAIIKCIYLDENRDWLPLYEGFAELVTLRNQLEVVKILNDFNDPEATNKEQMEKIRRQQAKIVMAGYHTLYKIEESKLSDWNVLKSKTNSANLQKFEIIRQSISKTPLVKALLLTGFQVYNLGSQMAHSSFNMVSSMVYFNGSVPLYSEIELYKQILLLMRCVIEQYGKHGVLTETECNSVMNVFRTELKKHLMDDN